MVELNNIERKTSLMVELNNIAEERFNVELEDQIDLASGQGEHKVLSYP